MGITILQKIYRDTHLKLAFWMYTSSHNIPEILNSGSLLLKSPNQCNQCIDG